MLLFYTCPPKHFETRCKNMLIVRDMIRSSGTKIQCSDSDLNNSVGCKIYSRDDCELENDVSSLTYILYSLEFCAFLQGFWPLDRSTFVFIVSLISKKEDDYFQLEQIRDVYGKRNSRKKDLNSSVILRGGSKEKSASDVIHQVFTKINFSFYENSR